MDKRLSLLIAQISILLLLFSPFIICSYTYGEEKTGETGSERVHTVKNGDTLWDISGEYLNNPYLWPYIWVENRYIKDPDLIYPGNTVKIPYINIFSLGLDIPVEGPVSGVEEAPSPPIPPSTQEVEEPPLSQDLIRLIHESGYIAEDIVSSGHIIDSPEGRNVFGKGDTVDILFNETGNVSVGDRFTIFRPPHRVLHPVNRKYVGMLFIPVGILEISRIQGREASGIIVASYRYVFTGDNIQPYEVPEVIYKEGKGGIEGYIVEALENKSLNGKGDIVYIDKGILDGISAKSILTVLDEDGEIVGELTVIRAEADTATALVVESLRPFGKGFKVVSASK